VTRDEIMAIADKHSNLVAGWMFSAPQVESLWKEAFELGAAAEREACAQLVENYALQYAEPVWALKLTEAIRERGEK